MITFWDYWEMAASFSMLAIKICNIFYRISSNFNLWTTYCTKSAKDLELGSHTLDFYGIKGTRHHIVTLES